MGLLAVPEYREPILEGLLASIGGLDASLSKEATAALLDTVSAKNTGAGGPMCMSCSPLPFESTLSAAKSASELRMQLLPGFCLIHLHLDRSVSNASAIAACRCSGNDQSCMLYASAVAVLCS